MPCYENPEVMRKYLEGLKEQELEKKRKQSIDGYIESLQSKTKYDITDIKNIELERINFLTQLLCYVMNQISNVDIKLISQLCTSNQELDYWWKLHQEFDNTKEQSK